MLKIDKSKTKISTSNATDKSKYITLIIKVAGFLQKAINFSRPLLLLISYFIPEERTRILQATLENLWLTIEGLQRILNVYHHIMKLYTWLKDNLLS